MELKILLLLVIVLICLIPIIYDPKPTPRQKSTYKPWIGPKTDERINTMLAKCICTLPSYCKLPLFVSLQGRIHAATTMQRLEQPSYTHSSAAVRHMMLMFDRGWRMHSEESLQKRTLTSYYLATGRYYPLIADNNQPLPATSRHYRVLPQ
jgi:hypothetical protein